MNPMKFPRSAWLLAAFALALPAFGAEETPSLSEALKRFRDVPPPVTSASPDAQPATANNMRDMSGYLRGWNEAQNQLGNLQSYFDNNDYANAVRQARQYARSARTPEIRKLWEDLVAALDAQAKTQTDAYIKQVSEMVDRYGKAALGATKADALDSMLDELTALREVRNQGGGYNNPRAQRANQRLDGLSQFLVSWQDYLMFVESGDMESARNVLRNLSSSGNRNSPISRAEIITRMASLKPAAKETSEDYFTSATLDALPEIRERIFAAQEAGMRRSPQDYYNYVGELDRLIAANAALKAGRPEIGQTLLRSNTSNPSVAWQNLSRFRDEWYLKALPAITGIATPGKPAAGESTPAFIRRLMDAALDKQDWVTAHAYAAVQNDFQIMERYIPAGQLPPDNAATAINSWIKGQLLEKAAQPVAAAELYRDALKAGAPAQLEVKLIERLRALATEVPESVQPVR